LDKQNLVGINWQKFESMGRIVNIFSEIKDRNPLSSIAFTNGSVSLGTYASNSNSNTGQTYSSSSGINNRGSISGPKFMPFIQSQQQSNLFGGPNGSSTSLSGNYSLKSFFDEFGFPFVVSFLGQQLLSSDEQYDISLSLEPRAGSVSYLS
ncbi:hypothetical protein AYI70_g10606, partial [Smittium culicis]